MPTKSRSKPEKVHPGYDWEAIARLLLVSRGLDLTEEERLVPAGRVLYQFTARGHDLAQLILGTRLTEPHDGVSAYYRSRPLLLASGLSLEDAFAGPMAKSGGFSNGRDIGVVCNLPPASAGRPTVLPMAGEVGSQFTPGAGWAQAIRYRHETLGDESYARSISVVHFGDGAVATNGFWAALTIATTLELPVLFYMEDNAYGISVPSTFQTPGANIAANLASFANLEISQGDGTSPAEAAPLIDAAVNHVRARNGPALLRLTVPRLSGHSGQDTQAYKPPELIEEERARDPLPQLKAYLVPAVLSDDAWNRMEHEAAEEVAAACEAALARPEPDPGTIGRYVFTEHDDAGSPEVQRQGGLLAEGDALPQGSETATPEPPRINLVTAIRRTLDHELAVNAKLVVFGEDVGPKGGVHAATLGLQEKYGAARVFDTSLSEEGIIGRAVGMALAGLMPVAEIQFRKYADPACEQLMNCGTIRWRTNNRMAAPIVVRMPGGFFKCGDPWHSMSNEVQFVHAVGWQVAMPSNAEDAVGLLRTALRANEPTIFFEHRNMLDASAARRPYPGDDFIVPFGKASTVQAGDALTVVTWGALVHRCIDAAKASARSIEVLDLRTLAPWDREAVLASVRKTKRCLVVHEDGRTAGFGAEIVATLVAEAFLDLDAPIERVCVPDLPIPYNVALMKAVVPTAPQIEAAMLKVLEF